MHGYIHEMMHGCSSTHTTAAGTYLPAVPAEIQHQLAAASLQIPCTKSTHALMQQSCVQQIERRVNIH
jgi:hypothetical protein